MKRGRRRANQAKGRSLIELLPDLMVVEILSRLPVKTIISCRCVCKTWHNLLSDPHFAELHFSRAPVEFLLQPCGLRTLLLAELDEGSCIKNCDVNFRVGRKSIIDFKTHTPNPLNNDLSQIEICSSSCDGLFCLGEAGTWNPYHIYNPITGEHVVIPQTVKDSSKPIHCVLGFSRKTNEFKLLRFLCHTLWDNPQTRHDADLHTVGTDSWRSIGVTPRGLSLSWSAPSLHGSLHWISCGDGLIFAFDFGEEKFIPLPPPSCFSGEDHETFLKMSLGSFGGCLSLCYPRYGGTPIDIWVMNEYGMKESWTKQFVIDNIVYSYDYQPIRLMKNGEVLVLCGYRTLVSYNPTRRSFRYIKFYGSSRKNFCVIPYIPSFIKVLQ